MTGCGTILYPERRGQLAGRLDWGVVALDGIGLILFFVPGVIAFAVDFATGAIYLPYDGYGNTEPPRSRLRRIDVPRSQLTPHGVAHAVSAATGRPVSLDPGDYQTRPLAHLDAYWDARNEFAAANDTATLRSVLRSQSP
ncbi:MAG: hypothetical protein AB7U20_15475 [Planctomycetaceae bacterium]